MSAAGLALAAFGITVWTLPEKQRVTSSPVAGYRVVKVYPHDRGAFTQDCNTSMVCSRRHRTERAVRDSEGQAGDR
jgi:glutamine cyclotransferase